MGPREFSTAMRFIALAQNGYQVNDKVLEQSAGVSLPAPTFQGIELKSGAVAVPAPASEAPATPTAVAAAGVVPSSWAIPSEIKTQYEKSWATVPKNATGMLEGKDAVGFFAKSGQSRETLRTVWQLADVGGDGMMDQSEFFIGMHLTMMAKKGAALPAAIPQDLLRSAGVASAQVAIPDDSYSPTNAAPVARQSSAKQFAVPAAVAAAAVPSALDDSVAYNELRQDSEALNSSLVFSSNRISESATMVKAQAGRATNELVTLKAERERLMSALAEATNTFNADAEKLRAIDDEVIIMREELARLRQTVDAKRSAVGAQQDLISSKADESRTIAKQMAAVSAGSAASSVDSQAGKRRQPPIPPPADPFQNSGFPSGEVSANGGNAFDAFDDPYGSQGTGGKSNEF